MSLQRKAPLGRGTKGLQRKTPLTSKGDLAKGAGLKPSKGPKARSKKRAAEMPQRRALYDLVRARDGNTCAWPNCFRPFDDVHEVLTRARGGSHIDERVVIGLCRMHNEQATDTRPAECKGVVVPSWAAEQDLEAAMEVARRLRLAPLSDPQPCPWRRNGEPCTSTDDTQRRRCDALQG